MKKEEKYALCLGLFAPCADRFVTAGYHDELSLEAMLEKAASVEGANAIELDYPFMEPAGRDASKLQRLLDNAGLKLCTIEVDHYGDPKWKFGALTSHDPKLRREAIDLGKQGMDVAAELGVDQINLWLGHDGYDYPMEADYKAYWQWTVEGTREIAEHRKDIKVCIEYKPREPRVYSLVATVGKTLLVANEVGLENVGVNIDTGHALMGFENLADSAVLCHRHNKLFYLHMNDNYREWDDDMIVGSVHVWETLELLYWLDKLGYDGWYSLDIYPYRQDATKAAEQSIRNMKALWRIARSLDEKKLTELRKNCDAPSIMKMLQEATFK